MDAYNGLDVNNGTFTAVSVNDYKERVSYDPNGNILIYTRNGDATRLTMDDLSYFYKANTNQLHKVTDAATDAAPGDYSKYNDIKQGQADDNYQYDEIGNLVADNAEGVTNVTWNVYGKISSVTKSGSLIRYVYDAAGNRIMKQTAADTTIYVRDASGNVMSVYSKPSAGVLVQSEMHLYGSSRVGMATLHAIPDTSVVLPGGFKDGAKRIFVRGEKLFELSNHLDNVLSTVSDKKVSIDQNNDGEIDYYTVEVSSANDYYPGGMQLSGRRYSAGNYAYGFNGKRMDNDMSGIGGQYDYGFRIYDPRLVRFKSIDPLTKDFPMLTPFQFASNSPIANIDLDGLESLFYIKNKYEFYGYNGKLLSTKEFQVRDKSREVSWAANKLNFLTSGESKMGTSILYVNNIDRIDVNGKVTHETKILGELYIPAEGDKTKGGFYFTSEKGGGSGTNSGGSMAGSNNNLVPIDMLMAAAGFPTDGGEVENTKKFIQIFAEGGKKAEEIVELAEAMVKGVRGAYDAGDKIGERVDKIKDKIWKKGSVYHDEDLGVNIERTSDSSGALTDKIPTDTLHNKKNK